METSLRFGSLTAERGVSNLMDAFPFQISNHVAVAISRKKSREPAKGPQPVADMTNACSARLLARSSTFSGCFRGCFGGLVGLVKGRVERPGGDHNARRAPRTFRPGIHPSFARRGRTHARQRSPRIAPRRGVGREERDGVGGGAQRVEFYFIFQTREAGCASRGPNRARCASR